MTVSHMSVVVKKGIHKALSMSIITYDAINMRMISFGSVKYNLSELDKYSF